MLKGLTVQEAEYARLILQELKAAPWAFPLLREIGRRGGVTTKNQPMLFELRIAYELYRAGLSPRYEHPTSVGVSSIDFYLTGSTEFFIEVVSIQASKGVRDATYQYGGFSQMLVTSFNLYSPDPSVQKQSEESEIIMVQRRIGEKVFADGRPTKFPEPVAGRFHVIAIDLRGYLDEEPQIFASDVRAVLHGKPQMRIPDGSGGFASHVGLLSEGADRQMRAAKFVRERIHAFHFILEREFRPGELLGVGRGTEVSYLAFNPHLMEGHEAAFLDAYPLLDTSLKGAVYDRTR
jgi:hypothetical protein